MRIRVSLNSCLLTSLSLIDEGHGLQCSSASWFSRSSLVSSEYVYITPISGKACFSQQPPHLQVSQQCWALMSTALKCQRRKMPLTPGRKLVGVGPMQRPEQCSQQRDSLITFDERAVEHDSLGVSDKYKGRKKSMTIMNYLYNLSMRGEELKQVRA